ncbi:MAG: TolC family protein [Thermoguttaceae bacterium]
MSRRIPLIGMVPLGVLALLVGCRPQEPFYLKKVDCDLAYYKGEATEIEMPDVASDRLGDVANAKRPFSLINNDPKNVWNLTLEEAMRMALTNNKVMRNIGGQIQGSPDFILRNPEVAPTIYDPALAESNPRTGPEGALAAFDAQWSTSIMWQKLDTPVNTGTYSLLVYPDVNNVEQSVFQTKISKTAATGGQFSLAHDVSYNHWMYPYTTNTKEYMADWNVNLTMEMRQPLLQGAGTQFNRIAGPGASPGVYNGVVLARINTDIALAEFENAVRNLVNDVEVAYWELYYQYRSLDAVIAGRDSALSTWRKIYTLYRIGGKGGEAEREAQAREQYYLFRSTAEQSLNNLYAAEAKLRYMLGLAATDGRLIRPKDEPTTAKVVFDWSSVLSEGLVRNTELREEKWIVKRRELELIAAKNFLLPRLDLIGQYRWLGFGNRVDGTGAWNSDTVNQNTNAYRTLTDGNYQEWQLGLQANVPIGFRRELAGVRNAQLALAKERVKLQEGELELSHQLAHAVRQVEAEHVLSQTNFNRRIAAQREVDAVQAAYDNDTVTLDVLLKAQQSLAQAESDYYRSLVDFNKSISTVHYRKGSLLEYNGVYLAEGPWVGKAYFDARRRATARAASTPLDYGFTQPRVISRGPIEQRAGGLFEDGVLEQSQPTLDRSKSQSKPQSESELVPTPEPMTSPIGGAPVRGRKAPTIRSDALPSEPGPTETTPMETIPSEPAAPKPVADPQASTLGGGQRAAIRIVDRKVRATGWTTEGSGGDDESRTNPSADSVDRSVAGRTGL